MRSISPSLNGHTNDHSSWDDLLTALLSHDETKSKYAVGVLSGEHPKKILAQLFPSFPNSSPSAKASFESAISGLPSSPDGLYAVNELKEDAAWLSAQADLDELEALRLAVLEWQNRPESRLEAGYSDAEIASLKDALGSEYVEKHLQSGTGASAREDSTFNSQDSRRCRLLGAHLQQQIVVLQTRKHLLEVCLPADTTDSNPSALHKLTKEVITIDKQSLADDIAGGIAAIQGQLKLLESGPSWDVSEPEFSLLKEKLDTTSLQVIATVLDILLLRMGTSRAIPSSETVLSWLQLMASVGFFDPFTSEVDAQRAAIEKIQFAGSIVTVALLCLGASVALLNETAASGQTIRSSPRAEYFFDVDCAHDIHEHLLTQAFAGNPRAGPAILAWAIIVHQIKLLAVAIKENRESHHVQKTIDGVSTFDAATGRRSSAGSSSSFQQTIFEDLLDRIMTTTSNDDPSDPLLAAATTECHVFDYISSLCGQCHNPAVAISASTFQALQELIAVCQSVMGYTPDLVSAQLALLLPNSNRCIGRPTFDPVDEFINDKVLLEGFYDTSAARFPYECLPFLQFSRALAKAPEFDSAGTQYVEYRLRKLVSFTQAAIKGIEYRTTREDESGSFVALNKPVNILDLTRHKLLTYSNQESEAASILPADTLGELVSDPDATPRVILWHHEFSGLAYMGQLLELQFMGLLSTSLSQFEEPEAVVSEIIALLTALLSTTLENSTQGRSDEEKRQHCSALLLEVSSHLNPDADVVSYVFDILEQELQSFRRRTVSSFDCRILHSCLDFIIILTKIQPRLVWSGINRTSLLGPQASSSLIFAIVSAVDVPQRMFDFLEKCAKLYRSLIGIALVSKDDGLSLASAPFTRGKSTIPAASRFQGPILSSSTEIMFLVFQEISEWSFDSPEQQVRINALISESFVEILRYTFDVGPSLDSFTGATTAFADSAKYLVYRFRSSSVEDITVNPLIRPLFLIGTEQSAFTSEDCVDRYLASSLSLAMLLTRYGQMHQLPMSSAEIHIFNAIPALVRVLQARSSVRIPCLRLLRAILVYVEAHQPSSLLGHLGSHSCTDLLHVIQHLDQKSESAEERSEMWKLLTLLVKSSQQWMAMVILTGSAPDSSGKTDSQDVAKKSLRGKSFLRIAMDQARDICNLPQQVAIATLEFLREAQQNWPWITEDLNSSEDFFSLIIAFVINANSRRSDEVFLAYQNLIAARVTDISATRLHHAIISRDMNAIKTFIPLVNWLTTHAIEVAIYNASLHTNLQKNFAAKYGGLSPSDIKRTGLTEREYDCNFFYDLDYADKLFSNDSYWHGGRTSSSNQSFRAEFQRANANLSAVDSELALLMSLERLCIDHCRFFVQDREIQRAMARIVRSCLEANCQVYPTEVVFDSVFQTRADLSMGLLRELVAVGARGSDFVSLLEPAWDAVRFRNGSYDQAIINNDLTYWRATLYILLMTIQFHVNKKRKPTMIPGTNTSIVTLDPENSIFLEITSNVVADGFKAVVAALQEQKQKKLKTDSDSQDDLIGPRDISLLMTIMQAILRMPSLPQFSVELSERISSSGILGSCLLLYSWSHLLSDPELDYEPRYADLCAQILASLSSLPPVAEELAVDGVLSRLLSSKTTESLQRVPGGASHVDPRPNCGVLYRIWAKGLLPLCLNLLHAVGGAIAPEISNFLNQFPNQLIRASTSFMVTPQTRAEGTDILTLTVSSEAATLSLLSYILSSLREAGASAAVDPTAISPLKGYDEHRKAIAEDLKDILALKEDARRKMTVPTTEKEKVWQNAKDGDKLDPKVVRELNLALNSLSNDDGEEEK